MPEPEEPAEPAEPADPASAAAAEKVTLGVILGDRAVRAAMVASLANTLGYGLIAPILPLFARSFGVGYDAAGLLISGFAFARLVFDLGTGPIVDRLRERMAASVGVAVIGVSAMFTAAAPTFSLAVIARAAGGAGSAVMFAAIYSYLLKVVPKDRVARTLSVYFGTFNIGAVAGAPLGGLLAHLFGLRAPLWIYAGLCLLSGWMFLRQTSDPPREDGAGGGASARRVAGPAWRRALRAARDLFGARAFRAALGANLAGFWVSGAAISTLVPLFAQHALRMSPFAIGGAIAALTVTEFALLYPAAAFSDRHGRKGALLAGLGLVAVLTAALPFAPSALWFGVLMAAGGIGSGIWGSGSSAMLADLVPQDAMTTAVSVYRFFGDLGFVLGPALAGLCASGLGFRWAFLVSVVPTVVAFGMVARAPDTRRLRPPGRDEGVGL